MSVRLIGHIRGVGNRMEITFWKSEIELEIVWKSHLEIGNHILEIGNRGLEIGNRAGNRKSYLEIGNRIWKSEIGFGNRKSDLEIVNRIWKS